MRNPNDPNGPDEPNTPPGTPAPPPDRDPFAEALQALYQRYYHREATAAEVEGHRGNPGGLAAVEAMFQQLGTTPDQPTAPPPTGGGPTVGNPGGALINPYPDVFQPPTPTQIPGAPEFHPPGYTPPPAFSFDRFSAPSYADVQNETGYAFARDEGNRAIEHSKAAKGLYNSPGTLKELARITTGLADQTYGNVFNRAATTYGTNYATAAGTYNTNYQSQYLDPYKFAYQSALDVFNPQFSAWQTNASATQRGNEFNYSTAFDRYKFDYQRWLDRINTSTNIATL